MGPGLFIAWVVVMALGLASYVWLAIVLVRSSSVPHLARWSVLVPPLALWFAVRAGGWPRAAAIVFALLASTYGILRLVE